MKYSGQSKKQIKFDIEFLSSAAKEFRNLPHQVQLSAKKHIDNLVTNPYSYKSKKLKNSNLYRIRIGKYRIIFFIDEKRNKVIITKIGHRKEVYR
jgi:mRNA interferase RelE/StbE